MHSRPTAKLIRLTASSTRFERATLRIFRRTRTPPIPATGGSLRRAEPDSTRPLWRTAFGIHTVTAAVLNPGAGLACWVTSSMFLVRLGLDGCGSREPGQAGHGDYLQDRPSRGMRLGPAVEALSVQSSILPCRLLKKPARRHVPTRLCSLREMNGVAMRGTRHFSGQFGARDGRLLRIAAIR